MQIQKPKLPDLEILISTMNRSSLEFLSRIFPNGNFGEYHMLIINQTAGSNKLESNSDKIRVINSTTLGLSKSRNLALKNAIGKVCLIADDDVCYVKGFKNRIMDAYHKWPNAALITFKVTTPDGNAFKLYPLTTHKVKSKKDLENLSSIEMTFNREIVLEKKN